MDSPISIPIFSGVQTLQAAVSGNSNGTALTTDYYSVVGFQVSGTFSATISWEGTLDGTTWGSISAVNLGTSALSTTANAAGLYRARCAGLHQVRARVSWASGTSVTIVAQGVAAGESSLSHAVLAATASVNGDTFLTAGTPANSAAGRSPGSALHTMPFPHGFNGTNWEPFQIDPTTHALQMIWGSGLNSAHGSLLAAADVWTTTSAYNARPAGTSQTLVTITPDGARGIGLWITNGTDQAATIKLYMYGAAGSTVAYNASLAAGAVLYLSPAAGSTGADANFVAVPALGFLVWASFSVGITPAVTMTTGTVRIDVGRGS